MQKKLEDRARARLLWECSYLSNRPDWFSSRSLETYPFYPFRQANETATDGGSFSLCSHNTFSCLRHHPCPVDNPSLWRLSRAIPTDRDIASDVRRSVKGRQLKSPIKFDVKRNLVRRSRTVDFPPFHFEHARINLCRSRITFVACEATDGIFFQRDDGDISSIGVPRAFCKCPAKLWKSNFFFYYYYLWRNFIIYFKR